MILSKVAPLFTGWDETLIWSCLQGCMGYIIADDEISPSAAQIVIGDFCFFAGQPNEALVKKAAAPIIVPQNEEWSNLIESVWNNKIQKSLRYAIKKEPNVFDVQKLTEYVQALDSNYELKLIDEYIYHKAMDESWSNDLCSQFKGYDDYNIRGLGTAVIYNGKLIAGASSYTVYNGGIEIEIDTHPEFRQKGFATVCGAKLILECLNRNLYPSWDAHDLCSVGLAEKLGYHLDKPYTVYIMI